MKRAIIYLTRRAESPSSWWRFNYRPVLLGTDCLALLVIPFSGTGMSRPVQQEVLFFRMSHTPVSVPLKNKFPPVPSRSSINPLTSSCSLFWDGCTIVVWDRGELMRYIYRVSLDTSVEEGRLAPNGAGYIHFFHKGETWHSILKVR